MSRARPITLLHLSDPQFGPKHRFDGDSPGSLFARLRDDFDAMRARHDLVPDIVLLTGDLVEYGKPSEFRQFRRFAEALAEHFGLPRRKIVLIPGNHDISRAACEAYFKKCEADEETPKLPYWPKLEHYARMLAEFYAGEPDLLFTETAPYTLFEYPDLHVVVAGLNSTIADSHRPEDHYGFLGEPQLRFFAGKLRAFAEQSYLRIAAVHHNPYPTSGSTHDLKDLSDLKRLLRPHLNLLVHGHVHEEELNWLDNTIPVLGIGSAGVDLKQRPPEVPNQYQWIRVHADRLEFGTRAYVPDQKRWIDDLRPDQAGAQWWQSEQVAFKRITAALTTPSQPAPTAREDALAREVALYRERLAAQLRQRIDLSSLATYGEDSDLSHGLDLLRIFVPQPAVQEVPSEDRPRGTEVPPGLIPADQPRAEAEFVPTHTPPAPIDALIGSRRHPWILLLGAPGAGKTTLTYWTALKLSANGEHLGDLPQTLVPVRIDLRLFADHQRRARDANRAHDLLDFLAEVPYPRLRRDELEVLAGSGRLFWLFDGLDEVTDPDERQTIIDQILDARTRYAGHGIVTGRLVGCRPHQSRFHAADIQCFTLYDLDSPKIDDFLEHWHDLVYANTPDVGARRLARLRETLVHDRGVRDLCGNPLLLTLIALLNRGDELPRRRHKLLARASELMLSQWDANKGLSNTTPFDLVLKRRYLAELAWHMLNDVEGGAGNLIKAGTLEAFTTRFCARTFALDPTSAASTARALIKHLRERNYVLGFLGAETFGFLHKAFFEFFVAEEIIRRFHAHDWRLEDLERLFADRWAYLPWEEPLLLVCGLLQEVRPEHVVAVLQAVLDASIKQHASTFALSMLLRGLSQVEHMEHRSVYSFAIGVNNWLVAASFLSVAMPAFSVLRAFRETSGRWPGIRDAMQALLRERRPANDFSLLLFFAALPEQERADELVRLLASRQVFPTFADDARLHGLLSARDATSLFAVIRDVSTPPALVLGFALALTYLGELRWPPDVLARVGDLVPTAAREQLNQLILNSPPALAIDDVGLRGVHQAVRELLTPTALPLWPELYASTRLILWDQNLRNRTPENRRLVESVWSLLGATPPPQHLITATIFLRSTKGLSHLLDKLAEQRERICAVLAEHFKWGTWPEGLDLIVSWTDGDPSRQAIRRLATSLRELCRPGLAGAVAAVELSASMSRTPDWYLFQALASGTFLLHPPEIQTLIATVSANFPDHAAELSLALLHEDLTTNRPPDEEAALTHMRERTMAEAWSVSPLRALYYAPMVLGPAAQTEYYPRLSDPSVFATVVQSASTARDWHQLYNVASRVAGLSYWDIPWQALLRYIADNCPVDGVRMDAAFALEDRALLAEALTSMPENEKVQAALDLLDARQRLLQIGKPRRAIVRLDGTRVGLLTELPGGDTRFTYDLAYLAAPDAHPLAPTLPLRPEPYDSPGLHPIFAALLPQGWLLDIDLRKYNLRPGDEFGLLLATGRDTIGAIEIIPE